MIKRSETTTPGMRTVTVQLTPRVQLSASQMSPVRWSGGAYLGQAPSSIVPIVQGPTADAVFGELVAELAVHMHTIGVALEAAQELVK